MRFTKKIVAGIVQNGRCCECATNFNGAMFLVNQNIICANCYRMAVFA